MPKSDLSIIDPPIVADTRTGNPAHPRQGEALRARKEKVARMDMEQAIAVVVGRDKILAEISRLHGEERAVAAAEIFGFNPARFLEDRETALKTVRQASRTTAGGWGILHDQQLTDMIMSGAPDADVWQKRNQLLQQAANAAQARADRQERETGPAVPLQKQVSTVNPKLSSWGSDHDERVMAVMLRPGASLSEIARVRQQVEQEYADAEELAAQGKTLHDVEDGQRRATRTRVSTPPMPAAAPGSTP